MTPPSQADLFQASLLLAKELSLDLLLDQIGQRFIAACKGLLPGRALGLRIVDEKRHELSALFLALPPKGPGGCAQKPLSEVSKGPLWIKRAALRHTGLPADIATSARVRLTDRHMPLFSATVHGFSVPLVAGGELLGILDCEYPGLPEAETAKRGVIDLARKDEAAIIPLCNQLSVALRNLRLLQRARSLERQVLQTERLATIGQIAAGVVHELNNPLTSIGIYGEYLAHKLAEAGESFRDDAEKARRICEGAERIQKLAHDLMSYGKPTGDVEPVYLSEVVTQALSFCDPLLRRAGVPVQVHHEEGLVVQGVRTQLQQVVVNLLTNACHACAERGPGAGIRIDTKRADLKEVPVVLLRVTDTGSGIPDADRARIFEPFFSTKTEGRGTGLGLPIVKNIVEAHGGQVSFETRVGTGTCFQVVLPPSPVPVKKAEAKREPWPKKGPRLKKRTIHAKQG